MIELYHIITEYCKNGRDGVCIMGVIGKKIMQGFAKQIER